MYEFIIWLTVIILTGTILSGLKVVNELLISKGHEPIEIPRRWWK